MTWQRHITTHFWQVLEQNFTSLCLTSHPAPYKNKRLRVYMIGPSIYMWCDLHVKWHDISNAEQMKYELQWYQEVIRTRLKNFGCIKIIPIALHVFLYAISVLALHLCYSIVETSEWTYYYGFFQTYLIKLATPITRPVMIADRYSNCDIGDFDGTQWTIGNTNTNQNPLTG